MSLASKTCKQECEKVEGIDNHVEGFFLFSLAYGYLGDVAFVRCLRRGDTTKRMYAQW